MRQCYNQCFFHLGLSEVVTLRCVNHLLLTTNQSLPSLSKVQKKRIESRWAVSVVLNFLALELHSWVHNIMAICWPRKASARNAALPGTYSKALASTSSFFFFLEIQQNSKSKRMTIKKAAHTHTQTGIHTVSFILFTMSFLCQYFNDFCHA